MRILASVGILDALLDILDRDQPLQFKSLIDHRQFLNPILMQNFPRFLETGAFRSGHQLLPRHDLGDFQVYPVFKAQVPVGQNPHELPVLGHGNP